MTLACTAEFLRIGENSPGCYLYALLIKGFATFQRQCKAQMS